MSSLLQEIKHYPKESVYDNFYRICLPDSKIKYEKITRKKMIEQITKKYTPQYILDICTVKELQFLKEIVENNYIEVDVFKGSFEKIALYRKYLLFEGQIPDELKESVTEALKIVDFEKKEKQDEPVLSILGYIRGCGICHKIMVNAFAEIYGLDLEKLDINPLFYFWAYYSNDDYMYQDTYGHTQEIKRQRLEYKMIAPVYLEPQSYISIFYNGYDDTDPDIHALFEYLKDFDDFINRYKKETLIRYIQTGNLAAKYIDCYPKNQSFDKKSIF